MVCLHGFTDSWRTWELVLPALEREHEVLAPTLAGHAGGPAIDGRIEHHVLVQGVERAMDEAGFETADIVGNSLGGYVALQLASRGRARTVVALAPAGGWAEHDQSFNDTLDHFVMMHDLVKHAAPQADTIVATAEGRRRATQYITTNFEHIPPPLLARPPHLAVSAPGRVPFRPRPSPPYPASSTVGRWRCTSALCLGRLHVAGRAERPLVYARGCSC